MAEPAQISHVVYCRGCQHAWIAWDIPIVWLDAADRVAARTAIDDCTCTCIDDSDPRYEDWVADPDPDGIPPGAWA